MALRVLPTTIVSISVKAELKNYFVAAGFNSIGIQSAGGAGKVLADWIAKGHPPLDFNEYDVRRNLPFHGNSRFDRTTDLGLLYAMHWPYRQFETAAAFARVPCTTACKRPGPASVRAGWSGNWYAAKGQDADYEYDFGRQNWFDAHAAEHAVREQVGLFDQSSFSKFLVQGRDAIAALNRICCNNIDVLLVELCIPSG